jgi:hypothetical protein
MPKFDIRLSPITVEPNVIFDRDTLETFSM